MKFRRDDEVIVIAGADKGSRGNILKVLPDGRLLVSGVRMVKRHTKPNPSINRPGGIIEKEAPIQSANVAIYNPETEKADRIGFDFVDGKKIRIFKSTGDKIGQSAGEKK